MEYRIILIESEEGWAVSCPALRGCHSQGDTREEAMDNIRIAIREWLAHLPQLEYRSERFMIDSRR